MAKLRYVACPQCGQLAEWSPQNRFRPFCSERCKMIDLGAWASESYRVPLEEAPDDVDASDPPDERS